MSGKKNLNDASKEELITIVKQLHSKLQQQQQSHPATTTTTTSSSAGVSSSSQQLQHEFEERLNSLAEQVKLLKGELAATQKEKANLSREFAKLSEKSQADEETIQSLIQQVETMASNVSSHHQAPSTSTPSSSSMLQAQQLSSSHTVAAGATHAKVAPSSLSSSSTSHSNSNNSNIASSETHQVMREAMEGMKAHVRELESALHQAQEKLNEQTEWMRFQRAQDVLLKRLVHEDPQQQEGENADTVNNVVPSQQAPEAASASIQSSIVDEEEIRELKTKLRQLRVHSEVQQRLTESERLEVQRLMAINVNLQRQVQLLSQLSSNNNGLIKDTQHNLFAGLRNGGGGPDGGLASLSNSFRQPFPPHPQQQQPGGAGSTTEKSSVGGGGGGGPLVSSSTPPNAMSRTSVDDGTAAPQLAQPQQATLLMHSSSRRSLAASSTDGSSAQLQQQQQQQQHVASSALLPAGLQTPTRTLSNVASPMAGFVKTLPVIQLRGVTPRERKLLDRIKLLEDHVQSCDAFEAMRKQRIDEAERNRAEIMVAMQRQVDSLRHELSSLKQQQKQQQQQPPLQAVVVTVVHEDGTAAASMEQQQQPAAAAATTSIPDRQLEAAALLSPPLPPAPPTYQDPLVVTPPPQSFESSDFSVEQTVSASPRSAAVEEPLCTLKELEERDAAIATLTQTIQTLEAERAEREDRVRSAVKIVQAIKQREAEAIQKCQEQDILLEQGNEALEAAQHALNTEKSNCLQAQSLCSMYEAAWRDSCSWCESVMAEVTPLLVDRHRSPSYSSTSTSTVGCGTSSSPLLLLLDVQKGAETKSLFGQQSPSSHSGVTQAPAEDLLLAKQLQADLEMIRRRVLLKANDDDDDEEDKGRERRVAEGNTRTHTANGQFDRLLPKEESFAAVALPTEGGGGVAQRPQPSRQPPSNDVVLSESATVPSLITENVSTKKEELPDVAAASNSAVAFDFFAAFSPPPPPVASSVMTGTTGIAAPPPRPSTSFADFDPFA